jgi:hypothetical protein
MTAIAANSSATSAVAALLSNTVSPTPAAKATTAGPTTTSSGRVDIVDLSDRAKATLARAKIEEVAAGKLAAQLDAASGSNGKNGTSNTKSDDGLSLFQKLTAQPQQPDTTTWEAGSKYGDASISDAGLTAELKASLLQQADAYDKQGLPPEVGQALRNAVNSGSLKFQKASDIPDLNFHSTVTYSGVPGGLQGIGVATDQHPTGAAKDAIDQGIAIAAWTQDRGDVYITW